MVNFSTLMGEICWRVWGTPANFNGFRILASLLHRRRSTEVSHTLHCIWPSPGLVHYTYIHFWGLLPSNGILPHAKFTLPPSLAFSYIGSVTARHSSSQRQANRRQTFSRGRHLHSAGWPSRWATAHILVDNVKQNYRQTTRYRSTDQSALQGSSVV